MIVAHAGHDDASASEGNKPHDEPNSSGPINVSGSSYWRDVRANLVRREQVSLVYFYQSNLSFSRSYLGI